MMKAVGIVTNRGRDPELVFTKEVVDWLVQRGCRVFIPEDIAERVGLSGFSGAQSRLLAADRRELYSKPDFLTVLGGDGTILQVSGWAARGAIPILGINLGNMGYLTAAEKSGAFYALERVLAGEYKAEKRMLLEAGIFMEESGGNDSYDDNEYSERHLALNDVCISRGISTTMIDLALWINDEYIHTYRGDGLVVATPTGSTAYNLSAGGPILKPDVEMIAITPICAHMLFNRSFVVSGSDRVKIKMMGQSEGLLVLDGHGRFPLKNGDEILISKSSYYTTIMKTSSLGFYDILRQKMKA